VDDFALTPAERALLQALQRRGVRFVVVGMGAALLEGAPVATQDIDLWFEGPTMSASPRGGRHGGSWISGFGMQPPAFGGSGLERINVVLTSTASNPSISSMRKPGRSRSRESGCASCRSTGSWQANDSRDAPRISRSFLPWKLRFWPVRPAGAGSSVAGGGREGDGAFASACSAAGSRPIA